MLPCFYFASSATPTHTSAAEIQRRRSTSSLRKTLAATALQTNVKDAEEGATRLASPQESAVSRLKKPSVMQPSATRNVPSLKTRMITASSPLRSRNSARSPMPFMELESRTSPALEKTTIIAMAIQSLGKLLTPFGSSHRLSLLRLRYRRAAGDKANPGADEQNAGPAPAADLFMKKVPGKNRNHHVAHGSGGQNIA